jgi:hypothetical protein
MATPCYTGGSVTVLSVIDAWRRAMPVMLQRRVSNTANPVSAVTKRHIQQNL